MELSSVQGRRHQNLSGQVTYVYPSALCTLIISHLTRRHAEAHMQLYATRAQTICV